MVRWFKQQWRDLRKGRPGRRFQERYERNQKGRKAKSALRRFLYPAIGVIILAAGIVFCFIPGPGLPLVFLGGALLAERSWPIARAMDWGEVTLRKLLRWAKAWWCEASVATRNIIVALGTFLIAAVGYGVYHFMIGR